MADKFDAEIDRIRELLLQALTKNRYSIRELERKARVTQGLFRKPLGGDMRLSYRHVLQMIDAVGLPWTTFFRAAYLLPGEPAVPLELGAPAPEPVIAKSAALPPDISPEAQHLLASLCREMIRLGKLDIRQILEEDPRP